MDAFARAVDGPSPTSLRATLPGRIAPTGSERDRDHRHGAYRFAHDARGFRFVGGRQGPALGMLQAYQQTGADRAQLMAFRELVVAWSVLQGVQSLHEVLRASHVLGLGDRAEHEALSRDAARLHQWASAHLLALAGVKLTAPHHELYHKRYRSPMDGITVPDDIEHELGLALSGTLRGSADWQRLDAAVAWLKAYGDAGRAAMSALQPAHLIALYLYTRWDYNLFRAYLAGSRLGEATGRWVVRHVIRQRVSLKLGRTRDALLRNDPGFWDLVEALSELKSVSTADPVVYRQSASRVDQILRPMANRQYEQLPVHISMIEEALELLPPANASVWWGGVIAGKIGEAPG